jgi:hypothetical protein
LPFTKVSLKASPPRYINNLDNGKIKWQCKKKRKKSQDCTSSLHIWTTKHPSSGKKQCFDLHICDWSMGLTNLKFWHHCKHHPHHNPAFKMTTRLQKGKRCSSPQPCLQNDHQVAKRQKMFIATWSK